MNTGNRRCRWRAILIALAPLAALIPGSASAQEVKGPEFSVLRKVKFDQNLDAQLPLDVILRDENDKPVRLRDYFGE
ncbi:MAG: hypothetical protein AB7I30_18660, partial [Isosphaeraceae bacterium]